MNNNGEIKELEKQKNEILDILKAQYEEIFQLNSQIKKISLEFPEDFRERKFQVTTENGKVLTFGKVSLKKVNLFECEISAFQLKRNGLYYTYSEIVQVENYSNFIWL
ncbi:hypothetical protein [uncultured Cetobacterium sp.]|uniref:hypothetical protein n=1 Tax=uncultured Cetobacterium sp. TaxID=527638 RepID=UPI00261E2F24|nr:hypothetical protein [uncultured Cetobacterium sp.]